jgi:hypothetical protein
LGIQQNNTDKWISNNLMLSSKDYVELKKLKEKELNSAITMFESLIDDKMKIVL